MRRIGGFAEENLAQRCVDVLLTAGISATTDRAGDQSVIWIREEDQVEAAKRIYADFSADPNSPRWRDSANQAKAIRERKLRETQAAAKNVVRMDDRWKKREQGRAPVTLSLLLICVIVAMLTQFGSAKPGQAPPTLASRVQNALLFVDADAYVASGEWRQDGAASVDETRLTAQLDTDSLAFRTWSLRRGEIWRVFTPCLLHFGVIHLLFNLLMLRSLGSVLESDVGSWRFLGFVLLSGTLSNVGCLIPEENWQGGWFAGGMSGVLYAVFGWCIMRQRFHPSRPMYLSSQSIVFLLIWLVIGALGMLDTETTRIANWAHGVGFAVGIITGYGGHLLRSMRTR